MRKQRSSGEKKVSHENHTFFPFKVNEKIASTVIGTEHVNKDHTVQTLVYEFFKVLHFHNKDFERAY